MGKRITIEQAELTLTYDGTAYLFDWVNSVSIQDARENQLVISPQGTGDGITYRNGTSTPIVADFVVREVPSDLFGLIKEIFEDQLRVDILLYDKTSGDQYTFDQAIIRTNPSNSEVSEGDASADIQMNTNCSPRNFKHKPPQEVA